jgi:hypothetical protein
LGKKKRGGRYTPPKPRWQPWWRRKVYRGCDHVEYFFRVVEFLEKGPVDPALIDEVRIINHRTRWHF